MVLLRDSNSFCLVPFGTSCYIARLKATCERVSSFTRDIGSRRDRGIARGIEGSKTQGSKVDTLTGGELNGAGTKKAIPRCARGEL